MALVLVLLFLDLLWLAVPTLEAADRARRANTITRRANTITRRRHR